MDGSKWFFIAGGLVLMTMWVAIGFSNVQESKEKTQRYITCIEAMKEATPDPNDNSRASFLKDCQK